MHQAARHRVRAPPQLRSHAGGPRVRHVGEGTLAHVHELAVRPVRAHGEVRQVLLALVQQPAHAGRGQAGAGERVALHAEEQVAVPDQVAGAVAPLGMAALAALAPRARESLRRQAVGGAGPGPPHGELDERVGQPAGVREAGAWHG